MKRITILITAAIVTLTFTSFNKISKEEQQIKITITSDKSTKFDIFQSDGVTGSAQNRVERDLKTPYELKVSSDGRLIFKSSNLKSTLKIKVESHHSTDVSVLKAGWPITVLVINQGNVEAFGMD